MHSVTLLVVTKTFPASDVREAFEAGECRFGENYVQEAVDKIDALAGAEVVAEQLGRPHHARDRPAG